MTAREEAGLWIADRRRVAEEDATSSVFAQCADRIALLEEIIRQRKEQTEAADRIAQLEELIVAQRREHAILTQRYNEARQDIIDAPGLRECVGGIKEELNAISAAMDVADGSADGSIVERIEALARRSTRQE